MRPLQIDAAIVTVIAIAAYFTGHHAISSFLGWVVFPLIILADWMSERRKSRER